MKTFSKIIAVLLVVLFIITTGLAFVLYNVEGSLFDAELYVQAFEKENLYQQLPGLIAQALRTSAQQAESNDPIALLRNLSEDEWKSFLDGVLPPAQLKILAEDTIRQIMTYLNGENDTVIISLSSLKDHLSSPQGIDAIYSLLKMQPDCTIEQLTAMGLGQQDMLLCNPPDSFMSIDLTPLIESEIKATVLLLPEQATLISADVDSSQNLNDLNALRILMRLSPVIPIVCLLMVTFLVVRSLNDWLNWWGYPLWLGGLFSIALIVISGPLAAWLFDLYVTPLFSGLLPIEIIKMLEGIVTRIAFEAVQPTAKIAGLLILVGFIMVGVAFLLRRKLDREQITK